MAVILCGETIPRGLDELYTAALEDAYTWDDLYFVEYFRTVLETILALQKPVEASTLDHLIGLPEGQECGRTFSALACVVANEPTVHLLHPTFSDYIFSHTHCGRDIWHFNPAVCHQHLALKCLDRLTNGDLKRNMCNSTLSYTPDPKELPDDITYACLFWIKHLCFADDIEDVQLVVVHLETFLNKNLLHWFEAMSIVGQSQDIAVLLDSLYVWILVSRSSTFEIVTQHIATIGKHPQSGRSF